MVELEDIFFALRIEQDHGIEHVNIEEYKKPLDQQLLYRQAWRLNKDGHLLTDRQKNQIIHIRVRAQ